MPRVFAATISDMRPGMTVVLIDTNTFRDQSGIRCLGVRSDHSGVIRRMSHVQHIMHVAHSDGEKHSRHGQSHSRLIGGVLAAEDASLEASQRFDTAADSRSFSVHTQIDHELTMN